MILLINNIKIYSVFDHICSDLIYYLNNIINNLFIMLSINRSPFIFKSVYSLIIYLSVLTAGLICSFIIRFDYNFHLLLAIPLELNIFIRIISVLFSIFSIFLLTILIINGIRFYNYCLNNSVKSSIKIMFTLYLTYILLINIILFWLNYNSINLIASNTSSLNELYLITYIYSIIYGILFGLFIIDKNIDLSKQLSKFGKICLFTFIISWISLYIAIRLGFLLDWFNKLGLIETVYCESTSGTKIDTSEHSGPTQSTTSTIGSGNTDSAVNVNVGSEGSTVTGNTNTKSEYHESDWVSPIIISKIKEIMRESTLLFKDIKTNRYNTPNCDISPDITRIYNNNKEALYIPLNRDVNTFNKIDLDLIKKRYVSREDINIILLPNNQGFYVSHKSDVKIFFPSIGYRNDKGAWSNIYNPNNLAFYKNKFMRIDGFNLNNPDIFNQAKIKSDGEMVSIFNENIFLYKNDTFEYLTDSGAILRLKLIKSDIKGFTQKELSKLFLLVKEFPLDPIIPGDNSTRKILLIDILKDQFNIRLKDVLDSKFNRGYWDNVDSLIDYQIILTNDEFNKLYIENYKNLLKHSLNKLLLSKFKNKIPTGYQIAETKSVLILKNYAELRVSFTYPLTDHQEFETLSVKFNHESEILSLLKNKLNDFENNYFKNQYKNTYFNQLKLREYLDKFNKGIKRFETASNIVK